MNKPSGLLALAAVGLLLAGCDLDPDTDNGSVHVRNLTDQTVLLIYDREVAYDCISCCCGDEDAVEVRIEQQRDHLRAGDDTHITVDSDLFDGQIEVEFDGRRRTYELDFDVLGFDSVDIRAEDFAPVGPG